MKIKVLAAIIGLMALGPLAHGQNYVMQNASRSSIPDGGGDVFVPISKYLSSGNYDALSAWFADTLEITILAKSSDASRAQARQIIKTFFDSYTPRSFELSHSAGRANMKYGLGTLKAGGETFNVTIFLSCKDDSFKIKQLKIERF